MENKSYLLRSLMFVPGHNSKLQLSASKSNADAILLDVEDSVPNVSKPSARVMIKEVVEKGLYSNFEVFVRVNEIDSGMLLQDVAQLTIDGVTGFLLSKTNTSEDVKAL